MKFAKNISKVAYVATFVLYASAQKVLAQCDPNGTVTSGVECAKGDTKITSLTGQTGLLANVINTLLFAAGAVSVIMIIVGGLKYTLSQGEEKAAAGAKDTILYAVVGLVVSVMAFAIVNFVLGEL